MPTLNWIGKEAVVDHHRHIPTRLLECDPKLSFGDPDAENLLVEGDNLEALKALLPRYRGQVKCIYIDPPYNTGNENWVYNDNVNDPRIKKWLGQVVGKEAEDLCRHDKWLCMMYPRLALLRDFLREDGMLIVSIDDNEGCNLRLLLDEIFGSNNFMAMLVWKARQHLDSRATNGISTDHEYIFVYSRNPGAVRFKGKKRDESKYSNPDNDPRGLWMSRSILGLANAEDRPNLHYDLVDPSTGYNYPCPANTGWRYSKDTMAQKIAEQRIIFPSRRNGRPREKVFLEQLQTQRTGFPSIIDGVFTADGSKAIRAIFGDQVFAFPKAPQLVELLIKQATDEDSIVLDSFAGSGTTGHAVVAANHSDGGTRKCVLIEVLPEVARDVTRTRLQSVCEGYSDTASEVAIEGLGSGFRYCKLGRTLLDEFGDINGDVPFTDLARYVYLLETGVPVPKRPKKDCPLLGVHQGRAIYLLYNGVLGDRRPAGGNVLTNSVLAGLPPHPEGKGSRVIFGEATRLSESTLARENIVFRQIPYSLRES